jgi:hypothetical protein
VYAWRHKKQNIADEVGVGKPLTVEEQHAALQRGIQTEDLWPQQTCPKTMTQISAW